MARILPLGLVSIDVFRAVVIAIVLMLVAGPNASLLCTVSCRPDAAAERSCKHRDSTDTPSVAANHSCQHIAAAIAFVREDPRPGVSASNGQHGVVVPTSQFVAPPKSPEFRSELRQPPPLKARPLVIALRI